MKLTNKQVTMFMKKIHEGLMKEYWGDIDPLWFKKPTAKELKEDGNEEWRDAFEALHSVLTEVLSKVELGVTPKPSNKGLRPRECSTQKVMKK